MNGWQVPAVILLLSAVMGLVGWIYVSWLDSEKANTEAAFQRVHEYINISRKALINNLEHDAEAKAKLKSLTDRVGRIERNLDAVVGALEQKRVESVALIHQRLNALVANGAR